MMPGEPSPPKPDGRESKQEGDEGEARAPHPPRASGVSQLSPALMRAIVQQLFTHRHELGRRERMDLLGARYGWTREVPDSPMPVEPSGIEA